MSKESRYQFQHGIRKRSSKNIGNGDGHGTFESWKMRRCLVFRTSKIYNDLWLEKRLEDDPENAEIIRRLAIAKGYFPEVKPGKKANKKEIEIETLMAKMKLLFV